MRYYILWVISIFFSVVMTAQELSNKELEKMEDEELLTLFNKVASDSHKAELVALTYLNRAKTAKDSIMMARGYDRLARIYSPEKNLIYADSVIYISNGLNNNAYPGLGYILKAYNYKQLAKIDLAIQNYITANELAVLNENVIHILHTNEMLLFFKTYWGNTQDALRIFKGHNEFIQSDKFIDNIKNNARTNIDMDFENYGRQLKIGAFICLATIHLESGNFLDTRKTLLEAHSLRKRFNDSIYFDVLLEIEMELAYYEKDYKKVHYNINQILNSEFPYYGRKSNNMTHNIAFFQGMTYLKQHETSEAIKSFRFADSLYQDQSNLIFPRHRQLYLELIKHYDSIGNDTAQMEYLNKLIKWDSLLSSNYKHVDSKIIKEFETPRLIAQKEALIAQLEEENSLISKKSTWILASLLLCLAIILFLIVRQRKLKKRFDSLIKSMNVGEKEIPKPSIKSSLSSEIIDEIMEKLNRFEEQQKYLNGNVSLQSIAKSFHTNSSYLSKVVNLHKDKNFSQYLNDLRVDYAIKELTNNARFRRYTIKAIAQDVGFGNSQSFSKAFRLKTGLQPSYFVRKLNKQAS